MDNLKYCTWDYFPRNLSPKEVNNPMIPIRRFFSDDGLSGAMSELKIWRDSVIENKPWTNEKGSHSGVLFYYTCTLELLDAAWLLKLTSTNREDCVKDKDKKLKEVEAETEEWDETLSKLTDEEMIDPYLVIHDFFSRWELPDYREMLYRWVENALSIYGVKEDIMAAELVGVYENLQRLYEATWVILTRYQVKGQID